MVAIVDFGSQYTHLIARRIRSLKTRAEIFSPDTNLKAVPELKAIILSGGPQSVYDEDSLTISKSILTFGVPILGICYGHHLLAKLVGGKVERGEYSEYGREKIKIKESKLFAGLTKNQQVWFSHGDQVTKLPKEFEIVASSKTCPIVAFESKSLFGIQFHPEVSHTERGQQVLENFLKVAGAQKDWSIEDQVKKLIREVKGEIGEERTLIAVSGGVDSLVAAEIINKAVGDKIYPIFVDSGLLRADEVEEVKGLFEELNFRNFRFLDASSLFLQKLKSVSDPEKKRKIIGKTFIEVFTDEAAKLSRVEKIKFLAQGTIYPDRIESAQASKQANKIKSHHNLIIPKRVRFKIIEPLADFYKDEVRALGEKLGLPKERLWRHPFPGPGLAIRIVGEVTKERLKILKKVDQIYLEELKTSKLYDKIWQAFAVLLSSKSVGVVGDQRNYGYIISLRAVTSSDGMTADWFRFPPEVLEKISSRIVNEVRGVSRVVYDITQKPPATIEYE